MILGFALMFLGGMTIGSSLATGNILTFFIGLASWAVGIYHYSTVRTAYLAARVDKDKQ